MTPTERSVARIIVPMVKRQDILAQRSPINGRLLCVMTMQGARRLIERDRRQGI